MHIFNKKAAPWDRLFAHIGMPDDRVGYVAWVKYLLRYDPVELHKDHIYDYIYLSIFRY